MSKGDDTKTAILDGAMDLVSVTGLDAVSIGALASRMDMSKSGLYAHFKSKEALQLDILDAVARRMEYRVFMPIMEQPRGLPRLKALLANSLDWSSSEFEGGCPVMAGAAEFDDRDGAVKDKLADMASTMLASFARLARNCIETGDFRQNMSVDQFAFDIWSVLLGFNFTNRLMGMPQARLRANQAFDAILVAAAAPQH